MNHVSTLENELQRLTSHLETDPHNPQVYIQRGMVYFKLGSIPVAIGDFDRAEHLNPASTPYLWQRGLAYYSADRFADGAKQFELDLIVNGHDVEETVWRYLCQARLHGAPAARASRLWTTLTPLSLWNGVVLGFRPVGQRALRTNATSIV